MQFIQKQKKRKKKERATANESNFCAANLHGIAQSNALISKSQTTESLLNRSFSESKESHKLMQISM